MPVTAATAAARQARHDARFEGAKSVVPEGMYCYAHTGRMRDARLPDGQTVQMPEVRACPHHKLHGGKPEQRNGYCRLLKAGDWMSHPHGTMLLWDSVKECGINAEIDEDDLA